MHCLVKWRMLCLGVHRLKDLSTNDLKAFPAENNKRYAILNPGTAFSLAPSDKIFMLTQFDASAYRYETNN